MVVNSQQNHISLHVQSNANKHLLNALQSNSLSTSTNSRAFALIGLNGASALNGQHQHQQQQQLPFASQHPIGSLAGSRSRAHQEQQQQVVGSLGAPTLNASLNNSQAAQYHINNQHSHNPNNNSHHHHHQLNLSPFSSNHLNSTPSSSINSSPVNNTSSNSSNSGSSGSNGSSSGSCSSSSSVSGASCGSSSVSALASSYHHHHNHNHHQHHQHSHSNHHHYSNSYDSHTNHRSQQQAISQQQQQQQHQQQQQQQQTAQNSSRYKTELCRPFEENGTCKYGEKCQFAHGSGELRTLARHPKYKTEFCRTFHTTGFCPYGPRCHFIHNSKTTSVPSSSPHQPLNQFGACYAGDPFSTSTTTTTSATATTSNSNGNGNSNINCNNSNNNNNNNSSNISSSSNVPNTINDLDPLGNPLGVAAAAALSMHHLNSAPVSPTTQQRLASSVASIQQQNSKLTRIHGLKQIQIHSHSHSHNHNHNESHARTTSIIGSSDSIGSPSSSPVSSGSSGNGSLMGSPPSSSGSPPALSTSPAPSSLSSSSSVSVSSASSSSSASPSHDENTSNHQHTKRHHQMMCLDRRSSAACSAANNKPEPTIIGHNNCSFSALSSQLRHHLASLNTSNAESNLGSGLMVAAAPESDQLEPDQDCDHNDDDQLASCNSQPNSMGAIGANLGLHLKLDSRRHQNENGCTQPRPATNQAAAAAAATSEILEDSDPNDNATRIIDHAATTCASEPNQSQSQSLFWIHSHHHLMPANGTKSEITNNSNSNNNGHSNPLFGHSEGSRWTTPAICATGLISANAASVAASRRTWQMQA